MDTMILPSASRAIGCSVVEDAPDAPSLVLVQGGSSVDGGEPIGVSASGVIVGCVPINTVGRGRTFLPNLLLLATVPLPHPDMSKYNKLNIINRKLLIKYDNNHK